MTLPIEEHINRDLAIRRNKRIVNALLDDWWEQAEESYLELWEPDIKGEDLLVKLQMDYPAFYYQLLLDRRQWIDRELRITPRMIRKPIPRTKKV